MADDDPEEGLPPLNRSPFIAHLRASRISLFQARSADWVYDPGKIFVGPGISAWVREDRVFGKASLFG